MINNNIVPPAMSSIKEPSKILNKNRDKKIDMTIFNLVLYFVC